MNTSEGGDVDEALAKRSQGSIFLDGIGHYRMMRVFTFRVKTRTGHVEMTCTGHVVICTGHVEVTCKVHVLTCTGHVEMIYTAHVNATYVSSFMETLFFISEYSKQCHRAQATYVRPSDKQVKKTRLSRSFFQSFPLQHAQLCTF